MELNEKEKLTVKIIEQVINGAITRKEAMVELNKSRQQIYRLINLYHSEGANGFIHKNRGKSNITKKDRKIIEELENLYLIEYFDYNITAFYEEIKDKYNISYDVILKEFKKDDIISPLAHKETIKEYDNNMKNSIKDENDKEAKKIELYESRMIAYEKAHTRKSSNMYVFGQEVQMDACEKIWFGDIVTYLHLAVDKATKKVLFGWFEYEELTRGYFVLLYNIILNYGIPARIKADNRNSFSNQNKETDATQFGIICNMLKIDLKTSSVSTAKANVERENGTFKNRLIAEFRHENIKDIDVANQYLNNVFIPKMNRKFSYEIDEKTSKMRKNDYTPDELNLIISEKYTRIIDNASSIKYNSKYYIPVDSETGEIMCYKAKTNCTLIISYNGDYWCEIENHYYKLVELKNRDSTMKKEKENVENLKNVERKKYIPPQNHPWRKFKI